MDNCIISDPALGCPLLGLKWSTHAPQPFFPARRLGLSRKSFASFLPVILSEAQPLVFDFVLPSFSFDRARHFV